jgi:hypothetical protein
MTAIARSVVTVQARNIGKAFRMMGESSDARAFYNIGKPGWLAPLPAKLRRWKSHRSLEMINLQTGNAAGSGWFFAARLFT